MKETHAVILILIGILSVIIFFAIIGIVLFWIQIIIIMVIIFAVIGMVLFFWFFQNREPSYEDPMTAAWNYAIKWWFDNFDGEELQKPSSRGFITTLDTNTEFYGFNLERKTNDNPIVIVIRKKGSKYSTVNFSESPTQEEIENPFVLLIPRGLRRTPEPGIGAHMWSKMPEEKKSDVSVNIHGEQKSESEKMQKGD